VYVKQGKIESPLRSHPMQGVAAAKLIGPAILDLTGNDGSKPGRGTVALLLAGQLLLPVLEPDGSLTAGASVPAGAGDLRWGTAVALSSGARRYYLALERKGETDLDVVRSGAKAATQA